MKLHLVQIHKAYLRKQPPLTKGCIKVNKKTVALLIFGIIAVSAIALTISSQLQNPNTTSNSYFNIKIEEDGYGIFRVMLTNKQDKEYLFSSWALEITNGNASSVEFGKGITSREGNFNLPPNETIELAEIRSWKLNNNNCLFNIKLTTENYGTVTRFFELQQPTEPYFDMIVSHKQNLQETTVLLVNRGTESLSLNLTLTVTSGNHGIDSYGNPDNYGENIGMSPFHSDHFVSDGGTSRTLMTLKGGYTLHFNPYIMIFNLTIEGYGTITHVSEIPNNP